MSQPIEGLPYCPLETRGRHLPPPARRQDEWHGHPKNRIVPLHEPERTDESDPEGPGPFDAMLRFGVLSSLFIFVPSLALLCTVFKPFGA